jgi:hypothetical protein
MGLALRALAVLLAVAAAPVCAQWQQWDRDFDEDRKPWKEIEARMPAYPRPENLLPFEGGGASPHRFFIDAQSVSIGEDGVVRYTLVIRTAGGATNVSFEGMRCEERQVKYYATGRASGTWERARSSQWRRIEAREVNRHHNVLYQDYLCSGASRRQTAPSVKDVLQRLRYGLPVYTGE